MRSTDPAGPGAREVRVFGLLWPAFFAVLAAMSWWRPAALLGAAAVLTAAWLVGLVAAPGPFARKLAGCFVPLLLAFSGGGVRVGLSPTVVLGTLLAIGLVGMVAILAAPRLGAALYRGWMAAAEPVGWTISIALLALVYYAVLTPIGLALRAAGRDPLERRIEPDRTSYWERRPTRIDPDRYFRQF